MCSFFSYSGLQSLDLGSADLFLLDVSGQSLSRFLYDEATGSISTPPGWDASPSQGYPRH